MPKNYKAMTLVELLAVIAILTGLLAVSIPMFKPVLESRRTQNAAEVVASTLQRARMTAIAEGRVAGVKFVPYQTARNCCIQMRFYKEGQPIVVSADLRVVVDNGQIKQAIWQPADRTYKIDKLPEGTAFKNHSRVQFGRQGRIYSYDSEYKLSAPYDTLTLPAGLSRDAGDSTEALEYKILNVDAVGVLTPQIVMPKGTVVDLSWSGGRGTADTQEQRGQFPLVFDGIADTKTDPAAGVTVMFSLSGYVQKILYNDTVIYKDGHEVLPNEMFYFCVGEWGKQTADGQNNLLSQNSYWVTLHPKTGEVRISANAPTDTTGDAGIIKARKYATEHYLNVGVN